MRLPDCEVVDSPASESIKSIFKRQYVFRFIYRQPPSLEPRTADMPSNITYPECPRTSTLAQSIHKRDSNMPTNNECPPSSFSDAEGVRNLSLCTTPRPDISRVSVPRFVAHRV